MWKDHQKWLAVLSTSQTVRTFQQRSVQFPELDIATMQTWNFTSRKAKSAPLESLSEERIRLRALLEI
ncbi:unnamed protein product [Rhizophagus irregularis]|nr:unnamed protein product [Rhizophagus irregularis]